MTTERPDKDAEEQGALEKQGAGTPDVTEGEAEAPAAEESAEEAPETEAEAPETAASETAASEASDAEGEEAKGVSSEEPERTEVEEAGGAEAEEPARSKVEEAARTEVDEAAGAEAEEPARTQAEEAAGVEAEEPARTEVEEAAGAEAEEVESPAAGEAARVRAGAGGEDDADVPDATPDPEAEHPRPVRHRSPVLIASVAAAVLLVGGGGAYLAASASGGSDGRTSSGAPGDGTPPPLSLDGYSEGGSNGIAPGEPNPYGVTYKVDGSLPDGPDSAPVYRASGEVTQDEVARLAKALGLDGTPVEKGQAWQVGPSKDGSGPSLVVNRQAPGIWTFHRYAAGTDACQSVTVCTKDPANPAGDTVSEAAAKKAAAPVLKAVGQDDAKVDASQVMGAQRAVNADPVVGGLPTYGWTTGLTVSAQGEVVGGSGRLKAPVKGDTYPVLGARKTLALLNAAPTTDHRMGIGGCASPEPLKDRLEAPCGQGTSAAPASPTPAKNTVTVEKAVFGLASHTVSGGQPALVPSWLFEVRAAGAQDTFTATYPAIDPKYLTTSALAPSAPSTMAPSDEPTSAPKTHDVKVDGYTADGKELTVTFTGGVCGDYDATASESADEVTVTVTETPWKGKVCIMIAKEMTRTLQLDSPLGDRKVVGSDGKEIPQVKPGARLPRESVAQ
ncbi:hypothetical protein ACWC09_39975 [Streptomyces sp. NPDC001617]